MLRQLFRFAAQHLGREFSSLCGRAWARLSCCLQRSVAQSILNRIDGSKELDVVEVEVLDQEIFQAPLEVQGLGQVLEEWDPQVFVPGQPFKCPVIPTFPFLFPGSSTVSKTSVVLHHAAALLTEAKEIERE